MTTVVLFSGACTPSAIYLPEDASTPLAAPIFVTPSLDHTQASSELVLLDFALSPDGSQIAIYTNIAIYVYDLASMNRSTLVEFETDDYSSFSGAIAFSSDSEKIAISSKFIDAPIKILDKTSKKQTSSVWGIPNGYYVTEIEFAPDNKSLLVKNIYPMSFHCEGAEYKVALYNISEKYDKEIYEIDKCIPYHPPIRFRFLDDSRLFLYWGTVLPDYSIFLINTHSGETISKNNYDWYQGGQLIDISPNGQMVAISRADNSWYKTDIIDIDTKKMLFAVDGIAMFINNGTSFLTETAPGKSGLWENGNVKCMYQGIPYLGNFPQLKISRRGNIFAFSTSIYSANKKTELQIWSVSDCKLVNVLYFDKK
jgi:hypothetical protein